MSCCSRRCGPSKPPVRTDAVAVALAVRGVAKSFGPDEVLSGIDLDAESAAIMTLLGPSGCGKTTLLRIVAGLETADRGSVEVGGVTVAGPGVHVPTERRRVGMVFQNGALFPHLSVAHNVGYGLPRGERKQSRRIDEMLELVGLAGLGDRMPDTLSGGQAQRVALARALAPGPAVLLMDEPFSNLDAVLRSRLRREVDEAVRAAGVTTVLVTHDRQEAFALSDRVAVVRDGRIVQVGTPRDLYVHPVDDKVAAFVGEVGGRLTPDGPLLRPEDLAVSTVADECGEDRVGGTVTRAEFAGADAFLEVRLDSGASVTVRVAGGDVPAATGDRVFVARRQRQRD